MRVLCFDISTGGLGRAVFDENLNASDPVEAPWRITVEKDGSAVLIPDALDVALKHVIASKPSDQFDAISFSGFMHSSLMLDAHDRPLTPVFTWLDRRGDEAVEKLRKRFGPDFHQLTGCRFHPMFPVFKAAAFQTSAVRRFVSAKAFTIARLCGRWIEDHGTASASGLYNIRGETWDRQLADAVNLDASALPPLVERDAMVGRITDEAASRYGLPRGVPVVAGSGDGFLANLGSGCETAVRIAVTLGNSSSARQVLPGPVLNDTAGTFCYRANKDAFLLGCASSNGGNVLDWARSVFGRAPEHASMRTDLPTFLPLLYGERSPEWDPSLKASWHGIESQHTAEDLWYSVIDGVVFNLAQYVEILESTSGVRAQEIVLSGNGFLNAAAAETLASVLKARVIRPSNQGLSSLRGAAVCGLQALGCDPRVNLERLIETSDEIQAHSAAAIHDRYERYRTARRL